MSASAPGSGARSLAQAKSVRTLGEREPCQGGPLLCQSRARQRSERHRQTSSSHKLGETYFLLPAVVISARKVSHGSVERIR